MNFQFTNL